MEIIQVVVASIMFVYFMVIVSALYIFWLTYKITRRKYDPESEEQDY